MGTGADFDIDIAVEGGGVEPAAVALARLSTELEAAQSAAAEAATAMKAGDDAYKQAETTAAKAAIALEKLTAQASAQVGVLQKAFETGDQSKIDSASEKLSQLTARQAEAQMKAASTKAAMNAEAVALDKLRAAATTAADAEAALVKQETAIKDKVSAAAKAAKDQADATTKNAEKASLLEGALGKLGGPLGMIGQKAVGVGGAILKMGKSMGAVGPIVAAVVLSLALAAGFAAAAIAVTKFAVSSSDAARSSALLSDGVAGSVAGGRQLDETIHALGSQVPQTRDELMSMASELAKTGLQGDALSAALEEAAIKAAKLKWGPDFQKQTLSLTNQAARLKANLATTFGGAKIEGLLTGMASLVGLTDTENASGRALKSIFETLVQPLIDGITALVPKARSAFIQFEILAMKAMIALKPYGAELVIVGEAFGVLAAVVVVAVGLIVGALLLCVAVLAAPIAAFLYLRDKSIEVGNAIHDFFAGLSLSEMGANLIAGLVDGIKGAAASVLAAMKGVVGGAIDGAKKLLGIASPSKVFAEIGMQTGAGMVEGVEGATGDVQGATEALVAPPESGGAAAPSATGKGGGAVYHIEINAPGGDAQSIASALRDLLADLGAQAGTAVPA